MTLELASRDNSAKRATALPSVPLSLAFVRANFASLITRQLTQDDSYIQTFSQDLAAAITACQDNNFASALDKHRAEQKIFDAFLDQACPKSMHSKPKILNWLCRQYLEHRHNGNPILAEDLYKLKDNLAYFDQVKQSTAFKDKNASPHLLEYTSYDALLKTLEPFIAERERKRSEAQERHMADETRARIMAESTIVYDGPEGKVVIPHTPEASQYWGNNTTWCVSGRESAATHFPHYNAKSPIIMLLPKGKGQSGNKAALADGMIWDSQDKTREALSPVHHMLLTAALNGLSIEARDNLQSQLPQGCDQVDEWEDIEEEHRDEQEPQTQSIRDFEEQKRKVTAAKERLGGDFSDRYKVLAELSECGLLLAYLPGHLKDDEEIVVTAVENYGRALVKGSDRLRAKRSVVLAAVKQDPDALGGALRPALFASVILQEVAAVKADNLRFTEGFVKYREKYIRHLMRKVPEFCFSIRSLNLRGFWQPDDDELNGAQINALKQVAEAGDQKRFTKLARHFKETWENPEDLFAGDMATTVAKIASRNTCTPLDSPARLQKVRHPSLG